MGKEDASPAVPHLPLGPMQPPLPPDKHPYQRNADGEIVCTFTTQIQVRVIMWTAYGLHDQSCESSAPGGQCKIVTGGQTTFNCSSYKASATTVHSNKICEWDAVEG